MKLKQSMVGVSSWRSDKHLRLLIDRNRIIVDSVSARALVASARGSGKQTWQPTMRLVRSLLGVVRAKDGNDTVVTVKRGSHESQS